MFRKLAVVPTSGLLAAVAVQAAGEPAKQSNQNELAHYTCKPSELPLYAPLHSYNT